MKRGSMRKPYDRRPAAPLTPIAKPVRVAVVGDEVRAAPKDAPVRSEGYRRWVAGHPCFRCGFPGASQAAHPNLNKGLSMKTSDLLCFPLCGPRPGIVGCHAEHDQLLGITRYERRSLENGYIRLMQALAKAAGRPEFTEA